MTRPSFFSGRQAPDDDQEQWLKSAFRALKRVTPRSAQALARRSFYAALARMPLRTALALRYFKSYQRFPNFDDPRSFSEKCQALKLMRPDLSRYVDKLAVKQFARDTIGDKYVIPTLYAGLQLPPLEQRDWPLPIVIKTNNGSGGNIFVRERPDWPLIEASLSTLLQYDFAAVSGETFYARIPPRVLVEPFISSGPALPLDYKVWTCGGEPQFIQVDTDRETAHKRVFFDLNWCRLPIRLGYPDDPREISKPSRLGEMLRLASRLAEGLGFVRVDFYEVEGRLYFGEMTFTPESGLMRFEPAGVDEQLGKKWRWPPKFMPRSCSPA